MWNSIKYTWEDHWKAVVSVATALIVTACAVFFPLWTQINDLKAEVAANDTAIAANAQDIAANFAAIGVNINDIDALEGWLDGFYGEDGTWHKFIYAYELRVKMTTHILSEFEKDLNVVETWLDSFWNTDEATLGEWQQFLLGLDSRINTLLGETFAGFTLGIITNAVDIDGLEYWAEELDDWATDDPETWDEYPEFTIDPPEEP